MGEGKENRFKSAPPFPDELPEFQKNALTSLLLSDKMKADVNQISIRKGVFDSWQRATTFSISLRKPRRKRSGPTAES
jgi:hypothetical protein